MALNILYSSLDEIPTFLQDLAEITQKNENGVITNYFSFSQDTLITNLDGDPYTTILFRVMISEDLGALKWLCDRNPSLLDPSQKIDNTPWNLFQYCLILGRFHFVTAKNLVKLNPEFANLDLRIDEHDSLYKILLEARNFEAILVYKEINPELKITSAIFDMIPDYYSALISTAPYNHKMVQSKINKVIQLISENLEPSESVSHDVDHTGYEHLMIAHGIGINKLSLDDNIFMTKILFDILTMTGEQNRLASVTKNNLGQLAPAAKGIILSALPRDIATKFYENEDRCLDTLIERAATHEYPRIELMEAMDNHRELLKVEHRTNLCSALAKDILKLYNFHNDQMIRCVKLITSGEKTTKDLIESIHPLFISEQDLSSWLESTVLQNAGLYESLLDKDVRKEIVVNIGNALFTESGFVKEHSNLKVAAQLALKNSINMQIQ